MPIADLSTNQTSFKEILNDVCTNRWRHRSHPKFAGCMEDCGQPTCPEARSSQELKGGQWERTDELFPR